VFERQLQPLAAENDQLRQGLTALETTVAEYRAQLDEAERTPAEPKAETLVQAAGLIVPRDNDLRRKVFELVQQRYPFAYDEVLETLADGYAVYFALKQVGGVTDWAAALVYLAKGLENQFRHDLRALPGFDTAPSSLGAIEQFMQDNFVLVQKHFRIKDAGRLRRTLQAMRRFRTEYRNAFIHQQAVPAEVVDRLLEATSEQPLFVRLGHL
jgi:hypothetical protein